MVNKFDANQARENSKSLFYTYETLLDKILVSSENMSKAGENYASIVVSQSSCDPDMLDKIELELIRKDFKVTIKPHLEDKIAILVEW